jgi:hypothetical protein
VSETVRAVVFDVGGVLEYTPPTGWQQRWAGRLGLDCAEFARRLGTTFTPGSTGAIDLPTAEREIAAALALDAAGLRAIMEDIWMCDTRRLFTRGGAREARSALLRNRLRAPRRHRR